MKLPKFPDCFFCGDKNSKGLNIDYIFENDKVFAEFTPDKDYMVTNGILHPGIAFGVLFEAMSWLVSYMLKHSMVLVDFNARILKPPLVGKKYYVETEVVSLDKWLSEARGTLKDEDGVLYYKSSAKYMQWETNDQHVELL